MSEKQSLLDEAKNVARGFGQPEEEDRELVESLAEPYASRYYEARAIAAAFATEATLENIEEQRNELDKADLGAVYDYDQSILMLAALGLAGMVFAVLLKRADLKQGYGLELPSKQ
jgi:hypothetical protein